MKTSGLGGGGGGAERLFVSRKNIDVQFVCVSMSRKSIDYVPVVRLISRKGEGD